jgi:pyruvate dehydrogenase E2 component (dihydrolipoamide acetyltransferase)
MACGVIVPRESEAMESCVITSWYVKKGDAVAAGDPVCGVETGKASFDLEAPEDGIVLDIFFQEGDEAPFLVPVAVIGEPGEDYSELMPKGGLQKEEAQVKETEGAHLGEETRIKKPEIAHPGEEKRTEAPEVSLTAEESREEERSEKSQATRISNETRVKEPAEFLTEKKDRLKGRVLASPKARMYAKERNISLETVKGTGPGGAVVMRDLVSTP